MLAAMRGLPAVCAQACFPLPSPCCQCLRCQRSVLLNQSTCSAALPHIFGSSIKLTLHILSSERWLLPAA